MLDGRNATEHVPSAVLERVMKGLIQSVKGRASIALVGLLGITAVASATPPTMPAITFPITTASIVTAIVAAGVTVLLAYFGVSVGFTLVHRLKRRLVGSV